MQKYDWTNRWGFVVKSIYGNSLKLEGILEKDCKINGQLEIGHFKDIIKERKVFSVGNHALGNTLSSILNELYPHPSKWER